MNDPQAERYRSTHQAGKTELLKTKTWVEENLLATASLPFSFVYDGKSSSEFLKNWKKECKSKPIEGKGVGYAISYTDPQTKLNLTCQAIVYGDYPVVEWTLYFQNSNHTDSPILEDVQALHINISRDERQDVLYPKNEFLLHKWRGCSCRDDDFLEQVEILSAEYETELFCLGGRSSSADNRCSGTDCQVRNDGSLPFFNIRAIDHGIIIAVGWTGQWLAQFQRDNQRNLNIRAGMELTHLKLLPGEQIRTPKILLFFWDDDRIVAHNKFRQMILDHYTPSQNNQPVQIPFAGAGWFPFNCGNDVNEQNQIEFAQMHLEKNIPLECFWIDAGWYGSKGRWQKEVGNWFPRKNAFPNGLKPVADAVHNLGMDFFLWFEPERVCPGTQIYREHPEWLFMPRQDAKTPAALLNMGNPQARQWITDMVSKMIDGLGMGVYRQDMNFDPLPFWRDADPLDRQGISEIRHIEGLYAFWDELQRRHPKLIIDNCATGGRRIDIEAVSRSIVLTRSDYSHPAGVSSHGFGLSFFVPTTCPYYCFFDRIDSYVFRSMFSNGLALNWDVRKEDFDSEQARKNIAEFKMVRELFYGDFYPLTAQNCSMDAWLAYQLHREDLKRGTVVVLRRPLSPYTTAELKLSGLKERTKYELTDVDTNLEQVLTGSELMNELKIVIQQPESSRLLTYREVSQN